MQIKKCPKCKNIKEKIFFYKDKQQKDGYASWCKECRELLRHDWASTHRELHLKRLIEYSQTLRGRYISYKSSANRRGINFDITQEEFNSFNNNNCHYCNDMINGIGIDRLNNNIGYIIENCVPCCSYCNKMKLNLDINFFINQCNKIVNNYKDTVGV